VFTVVIGLLGFFIVPPSPEKARFLSAKQKEYDISSSSFDTFNDDHFRLIIHRIDKDRPATSTNYSFTIHEVFRSMSSPHVLLVFLIFYLEGTNASGIALFLPSIINQMGFGANESQLLSVGPYAGGVIGRSALLIYLFCWLVTHFTKSPCYRHFSLTVSTPAPSRLQ